MLLERRRNEAIAQLHAFITNECKGHRLDESQVAKGALAAWVVLISGENCSIRVDELFPFSAPQIWLGPHSAYLKSPHVEANGRLCLNPIQSSYALDDIGKLTGFLLEQTESLLIGFRNSAFEADYITEFNSYWHRDQKLDSRSFLSLVNPEGPSRLIYAFQKDKVILFADRHEDGERWMNNRFGKRSEKSNEVVPAVFVWFKEGLLPREYPRTGGQFYQLAKVRAPESLEYLKTLVEPRGEGIVLFGFDTDNGPALASIIIRQPKSFERGFRNGTVRGDVAIARAFGAEGIRSGNTTRVDHSRIHSRGGEYEQTQLSPKTAFLIGCGSLGSGVAMILAKTGVGSLILCDGDRLSWENIARHQLGSKDVDSSKAKALAIELRTQLPHLKVEYLAGDWQSEYVKNLDLFSGVDLIICTTAEWGSESALNLMARRQVTFPPVLFGWSEPHAMAGHALLACDVGGCLGCGSTEHGEFATMATKWVRGETLLSEAACGGQYQPFGFIHMTHIQSLVAETAVDALFNRVRRSQLRTWVASRSTVQRLGGDWTPAMLSMTSNCEESFTTVKDWQASANCKLCKGS